MILILVLSVSARKALRVKRMARRREIEAQFRPHLIAMLSEEHPDLDEIARAVSTVGDAGRAADDLASGLMSKLRGTDRRVLRELLERRGAFERARHQTSSRIAGRRARAVEMLGDGEVQNAVPEMARLLEDRNLEVRKAAARAIGKLGAPGAVGVLMNAFNTRRIPLSVIGMAILHIGPTTSDNLRASLSAEHPNERLLAAECLGVFGVLEAVSDLMVLVEVETRPRVSTAAIRALGRIGSPTAIECLTCAMKTGVQAEVRAEAAIALGRIGGDSVLVELEAAVHDEGSTVICAATQSLRMAGTAGIERLQAISSFEGAAGAFAREALDAAGTSRVPESSHAA